jgi:D-alanyl-lipoteichoic acid acyltransferase DltB (MBOAT superfamily)
MIAWALMRLIGIKAPRNFRQPFGARSIIDYWQRWHISLSIILKKLFFEKFKPLLGTYCAVFIVFLISAIWHGISINFFLWGLAHTIFWCLSHYLSKANYKIFNYFLMIFGIVIGRIIFSEIDLMILLSKLSMIFNFTIWNTNSEFILKSTGILEKFNLLLAVIFIMLEVLLPNFNFSDRDYRLFKSPYVSTLIFIYLTLSFTGFYNEPIYGNR